MKIVLVSNTCSAEEYKRLQSIKTSDKVSPQQHFFAMMIDGFLENGAEVLCLTARSIAPHNCPEKRLPGFEEKVSDRLTFVYTDVTAANPGRNLGAYTQMRKLTAKYVKDGDVVLFDPLTIFLCRGALAGLRGKKVHKMSVVTDLPIYVAAIEKSGQGSRIRKYANDLRQELFLGIIRKMDTLCFLTKAMERINERKVPSVIVEGMVPPSAAVTGTPEGKTVLYAGGLYEKFGINALVDAARQIDIPGFELRLYGEGTSVDYIRETQKAYPHIRYMGVVGHAEAKAAQARAALLVNPRPTDEEYTRYSFPSKTLEYMSTGRPVLTTRLSGIPEEYFDYLYTIDDHTPAGIAAALEAVLSKTDEELAKMGEKALTFVRSRKNAAAQTRKLLDLMEQEEERRKNT